MATTFEDLAAVSRPEVNKVELRGNTYHLRSVDVDEANYILYTIGQEHKQEVLQERPWMREKIEAMSEEELTDYVNQNPSKRHLCKMLSMVLCDEDGKRYLDHTDERSYGKLMSWDFNLIQHLLTYRAPKKN